MERPLHGKMLSENWNCYKYVKADVYELAKKMLRLGLLDTE